MSDPKATEQKDEVLRLVKEHESIAAPLQQDAVKVVETTQANRDVAGTISKLVSALPSDSAFPDSTWNALKQALQGQNERARSREEKILSIGRRCGKEGAPVNHFQIIAEQASGTMDRLSGAKRDSMTREEIRLRFNEALLLLKSFVAQLDETRLRK